MNKRQRKKKLHKSYEQRFSERIQNILILIADEYEKSLNDAEYPDLTEEFSEDLYRKILMRINEHKITE